MLKKTAALAILALSPFAVAHADPDAGCGAGSKIWEGNHGTIYKIMAATTNGSFGNQTFGISSGTLGCHQDGTVTASARIPLFASANFEQLQTDMARGHGDALDALATLYGIQDAADRTAFEVMTQTHFAQLFVSSEVSSTDMLDTLNALMKSDPRFGRYVA
jgi:hypothetical protein